MTFDPWDSTSKVLLKYFWGWTPETWGTLSFTAPGRLQTIVRESEGPFIAVVCVSADVPDLTVAGKVAGFYWISHKEGHRNEFTDVTQHAREPERWQHGLKAVRAFTFLPEYRVAIYDIHPAIRPRVRAVGANGEWLSGEIVDRLRGIPFVEVPVYGGPAFFIGDVVVPSMASARHSVKAGPINRTGYEVPGEPADTEKELYVLELTGDASSFLEEDLGDLRVFKVGLSISPTMRLQAFCKTLPRGRFKWELVRSTRMDGHPPYASFEAAEIGERAMKDYLGRQGPSRWLGGEFYAATEDEVGHAWSVGRRAALAHQS